MLKEVTVATEQPAVTEWDAASEHDEGDDEDIETWSSCSRGIIIGSLICCIVLAVILTLWLTSPTKGTTGTSTTTTSSTSSTSTTSTETTSTSSTSTTSSTTSSTSSTSTSTSSSSSTSSTSSTTTTTSTTSTSTSSTTSTTSSSTSTTSTTSTATTSTSTTSTSATTTTTTSVTTTTTTSRTTTTTTSFPIDPCGKLSWDPKGTIVAGGNGPGSNNNQLKSPRCLHVRGNGLLHVCDYGNKRIQKWDVNPTTITTVTDDTNGDSPNGLVVESGGGIYLADDRLHYVLKYTGRLISVVAAGDKGNSGSRDDLLDTPSGLTLDNSLNLYVVDTGNNRVVRWNHQSTRGDPILNSGSIGLTDIAMSSKLSNLLYLSSMNTNQVVSWQINGVGPIKTFRSVNSSNSSLSLPHGIILDDDENLYVADSGYTRVVMFCAGSTMGRVIINGVSASPNFLSVVDIGLDSDRNLYVLDRTDAKVIRFDLN